MLALAKYNLQIVWSYQTIKTMDERSSVFSLKTLFFNHKTTCLVRDMRPHYFSVTSLYKRDLFTVS